MERETETMDVIELGAVSTETQGPVGPIDDVLLGQFQPGLSDDD